MKEQQNLTELPVVIGKYQHALDYLKSLESLCDKKEKILNPQQIQKYQQAIAQQKAVVRRYYEQLISLHGDKTINELLGE